jgi:competence protein ComEC
MICSISGISGMFDYAELKKRPLASGFLLFALGILYAAYARVNFLSALFIILFTVFLFLITKNKAKNIFFTLIRMLIFAAGILAYVNFNTLSKDNIYNFADAAPRHAFVKGVVKSMPVYKWQRWNRRRCTFDLDIKAYKKNDVWVKARGLMQINIADSQAMHDYADIVITYGSVQKISFQQWPGRTGYMGYLYRRGIRTIMDVRDDEDITLVRKAGTASFKRNIHDLRYKIQQRFRHHLPYPDNAMMSAMLVGRREAIPEVLGRLFINTGTIHVLSVSGLHVAVISGMLFFMLKIFNLNKKFIAVIIILFLTSYIILAGERAPILRASIMITVYFISIMFDRDFDIYSALAFAGLIILLANPMQLFDPGFQLSFSCVFFIVFLTSKLETVFLPNRKKATVQRFKSITEKIFSYVIRVLFSSAAVFIGTWPIVAFHFKIISPITIPANLFVVPFLGIILFLGIIFLCIPVAATPLLYLASNIIHALFLMMLNIVRFFSGIPFSHFKVTGLSLPFIFMYYILLYIVCKLIKTYKI